MLKTINIIIILSVFVNILLTNRLIHASSRGISKFVIKNSEGKEVGLYNDSYALVIGVSNYSNGWPRLQGVKNDVKEISIALEKNGFKVKAIMDPDRFMMEKEIREFVVRHGRDENNRLLFYYAGHGYSQKMGYGGQMGYLVPNDAPNPNQDPMGFELSAISMQNIETYARNISSKHALFVFDSCFAGSIFNVTRAIPKGIELKTARPVRQFITSGSADQEVPDQSVFRIEFIRALEGEGDLDDDGYVTASELGQYLESKVFEYRGDQQTPQYGKLNDPILNQGDFVFKIASRNIINQGNENIVSKENISSNDAGADFEAWEFIKDSNDLDDFKIFLETFPKSAFSEIARKKINEKNKIAQSKQNISLNERNKYWENKSLKQKWFRNDHSQKIDFLGAMASCNRLVYQGRGWELPSKEDFYKSFDDLFNQGLINEGDNIWINQRSGFEALFFKLPETLNQINFFIVKNNPIWDRTSTKKGLICVKKVKNDLASIETENINQMKREFNSLTYSPSKEKNEKFLKKYENKLFAKYQVGIVKNRMNNKKNNFFKNRKKFNEAITNSRETIGCGLFGFGCPDPLKFPDFNKNFQLNNYRRIKLNASKSSWTDIGFNVSSNEMIAIFVSGKIKICNSCGKGGRDGGYINLKNRNWLLHYRYNEKMPSKEFQFKNIKWKDKSFVSMKKVSHSGKFEIIIRDWGKQYPPPSDYYKNNSGSFLIDIFTFNSESRKEFINLRDELIKINPEDDQVKLYLGAD